VGFELDEPGYCDDGNSEDSDGCSSTCSVECGYVCNTQTDGVTADLCTTRCGDDFLAGVEECDDGNEVDEDGCSATCLVEAGYACSDNACASSLCDVICGDGLRVGREATEAGYCDDANVEDLDGCSATCSVECGFICSPPTSDEAIGDTCASVCGDGLLVAGTEECDDGNEDDADGCSSMCAVEAGWTCTSLPCEGSQCGFECGDGWRVGEELEDGNCDDGNLQNFDGCSGTCSVECGFTCTSPSTEESGSGDVCSASCGDGVLAGEEICDDGNTQEGDGCSSICQHEIGWLCAATSCGKTTCRSTCGDGILVGEEECDDGGEIDLDGCSSLCKVECGYSCESEGAPCLPTCGDEILSYSEACEDGNTQSGDGCSDTCSVEAGWVVEDGWQWCGVTIQLSKCGDGVVKENEECDDGNEASFDGCSWECTVECGWTCTSEASEPSACRGICGDKMRRGAEDCDDGNTIATDGCSPECSVEAGYACGGASSYDVCEGPGDSCKGGMSPNSTSRNCLEI